MSDYGHIKAVLESMKVSADVCGVMSGYVLADVARKALERIEQLERERDEARENAATWRERDWCSNAATSPFPWEVQR